MLQSRYSSTAGLPFIDVTLCWQKLELSWHHDIRPRKRSVCFDASQSVHKAPVILYQCHGMKGNQHFKYNPVSESSVFQIQPG